MRLPHVVPFARSPLYFFTACTADRRPILANKTASGILREIWTRSASHDGWWVGRYLIMPDHVHFFSMPATDAKTRHDWQKTWKSVSSRSIVKELNMKPPLWQGDTFDYILRSGESYAEKWNYVRENPVRAGLVAKSDDWPWQGELHRLAF
jgi:putative transposase